MSRTRDYRIEVREKKIKQRQRKIRNLRAFDSYEYENSIPHRRKIYTAVFGGKKGILAKHDYGAVTGGCPLKTKTKNRKALYRYKGAYGKATYYSRHDKMQIIHMKQELKAYLNNEREEDYDNTDQFRSGSGRVRTGSK